MKVVIGQLKIGRKWYRLTSFPWGSHLVAGTRKGQNKIQYDLVQRITQATEFVLKAIEELDNLLQV